MSARPALQRFSALARPQALPRCPIVTKQGAKNPYPTSSISIRTTRRTSSGSRARACSSPFSRTSMASLNGRANPARLPDICASIWRIPSLPRSPSPDLIKASSETPWVRTGPLRRFLNGLLGITVCQIQEFRDQDPDPFAVPHFSGIVEGVEKPLGQPFPDSRVIGGKFGAKSGVPPGAPALGSDHPAFLASLKALKSPLANRSLTAASSGSVWCKVRSSSRSTRAWF